MKLDTKQRVQIKMMTIIVALLAVVLYLPELWAIVKAVAVACKPVFVGLFLATVLNIPTRFFREKVFRLKGEHEKLSSILSIALTYILLLGMAALVVLLILPHIANSAILLRDNLPNYFNKVYDKILVYANQMGVTAEQLQEIKTNLLEKLTTTLESAADKLPALLNVLSNVSNALLNAFFAIIFSVYLIADQTRVKNQFRFLTTKFLRPKAAQNVLYVTRTFSGVFSKFIGGQITVAFVLGLITFVGMLIMGLPYAPLISMLVALINIVPVLGSYVATAVGMVILALVSWKYALIFLIFTLIVQQLEANVIYPKVVGDTLDLSAFWVLASVVVGGALFGFWGIMLGVPIVAVISRLLEHDYHAFLTPTPPIAVGETPAPVPDTGTADNTADTDTTSTENSDNEV